MIIYNPTIVIVAFNRPDSLIHLLQSLSKADYQEHSNVVLIISIDGSGPVEILRIAEEFQWSFGEKRIITHSQNLGLRNHVIECGDLCEQYESIILLEDDLFVSPKFYDYAQKALSFYGQDNRIAGISLYNYNHNGYANLPFIPLANGNDTYFMQIPSSLGQAWTNVQWRDFKTFYSSNPQITTDDKLPDLVKKWPESSWKKYFYKYMVEKNLFFVYPYLAYTTCSGDKGTHFGEETNMLHAPISTSCENLYYSFSVFKNSNVKYDAYFDLLPQSLANLGARLNENICVDLNGIKQLDLFDNEYWLSSKDCSNPINGYSLRLVPIENNIILNIPGTVFWYAKKNNFNESKLKKTTIQIASTYNEMIYNLGWNEGFQLGEKIFKKSRSYRLGNIILHPESIIRGLKRKLVRLLGRSEY